MLARYKILHEVGRGAIGAVYAARDRTTGALVALKRLDPALFNKSDANFAERVLKHTRSARDLRHGNIVQIHDAGEAAGTVYVAMEMVEGESLRKILDQGPLPIVSALQIAHGIACGLASAHLEGVVHGGIKPSNIIVSRSGAVKITDFGIGGLGQTALPSAGPAGLRYLSPEQIRGDPVDHRSDIFSLGALLYEMLTYRPPFEGNSAKEVMENIARAQPPLPSELNPHVPRALDAIVLGMLAGQPALRMPGMPIVLRDLQRVEEGLGLGSGVSAGVDEPRAAEEGQHRGRTTDREVFEYNEAMAIMERESRLERPSRSRAAIFAALAFVLAVIGIGFAGSMEPTDFTRLTGLIDYWSGAASRPTAPPPVAEAPKEPSDAGPEEPPGIASAPNPSPPEPVVAEPSPPAQSEEAPQPTASIPESQPRGTATLILAVSPRGEIYINGERHGITPPITKFDLEPGMHRIEVRSGSRKPYLTFMTVRAGDVRRIRHDFNAKPVRLPR
jgi:eukaryotic-like serine/threonine-protein kinase